MYTSAGIQFLKNNFDNKCATNIRATSDHTERSPSNFHWIIAMK